METVAKLDAATILEHIPESASIVDDMSAYYWVYDNIVFTKDPPGKENVQQPLRTLIKGSGDCDCIASLLASILIALGYKNIYFALSGEIVDGYLNPRHTYVVIKKNGQIIKLDASDKRNNYNFVDIPKNWRTIIVPIKGLSA